MAEMSPGEPQSAADYDDRTTAAVKTVLIEIGQILGSFKGKYGMRFLEGEVGMGVCRS